MNSIIISIYICFIFLCAQSAAAAPVTLGIIAFCTGDVDLLPNWLEYHTTLVGIENVLVVDKSEGKDEVFSILKEWTAKGIKSVVVSGFLDRTKKAQLTLELAMQLFPKQDLVVTINIEDFLVSFKNGKPELGKTGVQSYLENFQSSTSVCAGIQTIAYGCNKNPSTDSVETIKTLRIPATPLLEQYPILYKYSSMYRYSELKCDEQTSLGLLKFPTRAPKQMLENTLRDSINLSMIKPEITLRSLKEHEMYLFSLLTYSNHPWENKIRQLLLYSMNGYDGISIPCKFGDVDLADMKTIVDSVK